MSVKLSIIVPAYNAENYLTPCIESIISSTYQDFEVLLINDGSTDGTGALCDQLAEKYAKIRVFHTENNGLSRARNLGIDNAVGKYIGFVDSDDLIAPQMYEVLVSKMQDDIQMVCCRFHKCKREEVIPLEYAGEYNVCGSMEISEEILCNWYSSYVWNKLFRRDMLNANNIRFKPGYLMEDQYFTADCLRVFQKAVFIEDALYYYIDTPGSITNNFRNRKHVEYKYVHIPRGWAYTADAVLECKKMNALARAKAAMTYQSVLRKLEPENAKFAAEAIAYVRKNNYLLFRYSWGVPYFISGCILCISYALWKRIFRQPAKDDE